MSRWELVSAALKRLNQTFRDLPDVVIDKSLLRELVTPLCSDADINPEVRLLALKITPVIPTNPLKNVHHH